MIVKIEQLLTDVMSFGKLPTEGLLASVEEKGFLPEFPLDVQAVGTLYGVQMYRIICGVKRLKAARAVGIRKIPVNVINLKQSHDALLYEPD